MHEMLIPSLREYTSGYGMTIERAARLPKNALIMHPGPMNRGVEIDSAVADGAQSLIREQVEMGVAVRMAVLEALSRNLPNM
jgi:aspartate carbamoyltransferase catalytic subunit